MNEEIPRRSNEQWLEVSNQFNSKWNFPNCVGAIDGKHIAIKCPHNAGSLFFNYKVGYNSVWHLFIIISLEPKKNFIYKNPYLLS